MSLSKAYTASIQKEGEIFVATCIEVGTVSQGNSIDDAIKNLKEATELYLEEFLKKI
ncbi:MAG: type II toxin-antitoxin system HicB family antitoxin [Bacteroidia bacterium]